MNRLQTILTALAAVLILVTLSISALRDTDTVECAEYNVTHCSVEMLQVLRAQR